MGEPRTNNDVAEELPEELPRGLLEHRESDLAGELPEELSRGLVERLEDLQRRLGRCEGRLELTRVVETNLRKQLKRESERADRLEEELRVAEADLHAVESALCKARQEARRGWLARFFGLGETEQSNEEARGVA
jgi:septal ring factor EnvC (AmiA/AmiB activator)